MTRPRLAVATFGAALLVLGLAVEPAAGASLRVSRIQPGAAVAGAAIDIKGAGLGGRRTVVTVAGKRARVVEARARQLHFVVPRVRPGVRKVLVRRGRRSASARMRVLRPFRGKIGVRVDRARAQRATIGPAGGEVEARGADGTRYTLRVPAGALAQEETIAVAPIARFRGLPFTGGRTAGADLAPDGLRFATPATLEIDPRRRFPSNTAAFTYSDGGPGLELQAPGRDGRALRLRIEHFSSGSATTLQESDFANIMGPVLAGSAPLSRSAIRTILTYIGIFSATFDRENPPDDEPPPPHFFCQSQPVCGQAIDRALSSLAVLIDQSCTAGRAHPEVFRVTEMIQLEAERAQLGGQGSLSRACQEQIMASLLGLATFAARTEPFARSTLLEALQAVGAIDLDADGEITNFEWLVAFSFQASQSGFNELGLTGIADAKALLADLPRRGRTLCENESTEERGRAELEKGLTYASVIDAATSLADGVLSEFEKAIDFCVVEVQVTPDPPEPGCCRFDFTADVTGLPNRLPHNREVTWSASAGTVDANGHYESPPFEGTYTVTATSVLNPDRSDTVTVTVRCSDFEDDGVTCD